MRREEVDRIVYGLIEGCVVLVDVRLVLSLCLSLRLIVGVGGVLFARVIRLVAVLVAFFFFFAAALLLSFVYCLPIFISLLFRLLRPPTLARILVLARTSVIPVATPPVASPPLLLRLAVVVPFILYAVDLSLQERPHLLPHLPERDGCLYVRRRCHLLVHGQRHSCLSLGGGRNRGIVSSNSGHDSCSCAC